MTETEVLKAPELMTLAQVAGRLKVSPLTARRWSLDGRIPQPRQFGRLLRWNRDEVERFINGNGQQVQQPEAATP